MAVLGLRFLCEGFLQLRQVGATLHRGAWASHYRSLSWCGAQAPDAQAQQLWLSGLVAPRHVGSSQTRARTRVPCIGRQILNHCATREAHCKLFDRSYFLKLIFFLSEQGGWPFLESATGSVISFVQWLFGVPWREENVLGLFMACISWYAW